MEPRPRPAVIAVALVLLWSVQAGHLALFAWNWELFTSSAYLIFVLKALGIWLMFTCLVAMIHRGHNWARITYLVVIPISWALLAYRWSQVSIVDSFLLLVQLLDSTFQAAGVVLLLTPPAREWFRSGAGQPSPATGPARSG